MVWVRLAALAVLLALPACSDEQVVQLDLWRVQYEGSPDQRLIRLPVHLDQLPAHPSRYFLRAEVALPSELRGRALTLALAYLPAPVTLRVDGREVPSPDDKVWDRYRTSGPHRWRLSTTTTSAALVRLELEVDSRWIAAGWIDSVPRLSATTYGDRQLVWLALANQWVASAAASTGLLLGLLYLFIFLLDRRLRGYAWFGVGALNGAFYSLFCLGLTQPLFGVYDTVVVLLALCVAEIAAIYFLHTHFKLRRPGRVWGIALGFFAVLAAFLTDPFTSVHLLVWPLALFTLVVVTYQIIILLRLARRRPAPMNVWTVMACWITLGVAAAPDFMQWMGHGQSLRGFHAACIGIMAYVILQALALSREHTFSMAQADQLNRELQARLKMLETSHREIETLNQELRRQIADRSHQLSQALERMHSGVKWHSESLLPGEVVHERYRVVRKLGQGGMGTVYEVRRLRDGRPLALKIVNAKARGLVVARFAREAEIVAQIDHPNVVSIADIDVTEQGELFLVMELVRGTTLQQEQSRYGNVEWALRVLRQIAHALEAIHDKGIVHRDLKPANVLLEHPPGSTTPRVKIADFGIASLRTGASTGGGSGDDDEVPSSSEVDTVAEHPAAAATLPGLTRTGVIMGTPMYMAPELGRGAKNATSASDVYSLGLIAYELLSGSHPEFGAGNGRARPLATACPQVDATLARLVDRCLSPSPEQRPTASEFLAAVVSAQGTANSGMQTGSSGTRA